VYVCGLQNAPDPKSALPTHDAPVTNVAHWPDATALLQVATDEGGHLTQLCVSQSLMQPVSWLQLLVTNGLTQLKMPVPSVKPNSNGVRHLAHAGLMLTSVVKKDWHPAELNPSVHAAFASARSDDAH